MKKLLLPILLLSCFSCKKLKKCVMCHTTVTETKGSVTSTTGESDTEICDKDVKEDYLTRNNKEEKFTYTVYGAGSSTTAEGIKRTSTTCK